MTGAILRDANCSLDKYKSFKSLEEYQNKENRRLANIPLKDLKVYIEIFKKNPNKETLVSIYTQIAKKNIQKYFLTSFKF